MSEIRTVHAREILDSRGNPTVEVEVWLESGAFGRATGALGRVHRQARGGGAARRRANRYLRQGRAARGAERDRDHRPRDRGDGGGRAGAVDRPCSSWTARPNKSGARRQRASSASRSRWRARRPTTSGLPLYQYLGGPGARVLPVPLMNVLNGGAHADNGLDIQEFMLVPAGAESFAEALRTGVGDLPHAQEAPEGPGALHRRRATRAASRPALRRQRGRARLPAARHRARGLPPRRRRRARARRGGQRVRARRRPLPPARATGRAKSSEEMIALLRGAAARAIPIVLHRGRPRRGRLARAGGADAPARRRACSSWATTSS